MKQVRNRLWSRSLALAFVAGLASGAWGSDEGAEETRRALLEVSVTEGSLTLEAVAPLGEVLQAIGQAGGFGVVVKGVLVDPIAVSFVDRPLEIAIDELIGRRSRIIVRDDTAALAEITVFGDPGGSEDEHETVAEDDAEAAHEVFDRMSQQNFSEPPNREDLIWALTAADQSTQEAALPKVRWLPPGEAVAILSDMYAADADLRMRSRTIAALTRIRSSGSTALLRQWALNDGDPELRMQALNALATTAGERAITTLGRAFRIDPKLRVRKAALRALKRIGGPWARGYLERAARDLANPLQAEATQALASFPK